MNNYEPISGNWESITVSTDLATNKESYMMLLSQAIHSRALSRSNEEHLYDEVQRVVSRIFNWLDQQTDFYTAPASTKYHNSVPGGLVAHSLNVYNEIIELVRLPKFRSVDVASAVFVALVHDWCKINRYEMYQKNVRTDLGTWIKQDCYKYSQTGLGLGHGPQSLIMVMQLCNSQLTSLTFEEMAAIRWHMYTYDVTSYDIRDLNNCAANIPLVQLVQFADQLSIVNY